MVERETPNFLVAVRFRVGPPKEKMNDDFIEHLNKQFSFSQKTWGPGFRYKAIIDHIKKELVEIEADPKDLEEWCDVLLLAFDGAHRAGYTPEQIIEGLKNKQRICEQRKWPDWRTADPDKAIEHVRDDL